MIQGRRQVHRSSFSGGFSILPDAKIAIFIESAGEPEFSADFDRQASATNSVSFLGLSPPKASKTVSFFLSTEQRRSPESCSSFCSSEELHAGFTTVVLGSLSGAAIVLLKCCSMRSRLAQTASGETTGR